MASSGSPNTSSRFQLHFLSPFPDQLALSAVTLEEFLPLFLLLMIFILIVLFDTTAVILHDKICIFKDSFGGMSSFEILDSVVGWYDWAETQINLEESQSTFFHLTYDYECNRGFSDFCHKNQLLCRR